MSEQNRMSPPPPGPMPGKKKVELPPRDWDNMTLDWEQYAGQWKKSGDGSFYELRFVYFAAKLQSREHQYMNLFVPAAYLNEDGTVNEAGECAGYTARTAPVVLYNACHGWMSSTPGDGDPEYLRAGFVHVFVGARSRDLGDAGKAPAACVDEKAAVRMLRLHDAHIPGDKERIVSCGTSGGGQMSSVLGATGNLVDYYPYLGEIGAAGMERNAAGEWVSTLRDDVFASQCYCPIADIENADLAYAWQRFDDPNLVCTGFGVVGEPELSPFKQALQRDLAQAYCAYFNALGLVGRDGVPLRFERKADGSFDPRGGTVYDALLGELSSALNKWVGAVVRADGSVRYQMDLGPYGKKEVTHPSLEAYFAEKGELSRWLKEENGVYTVTDLPAFIRGTALPRGKDCPGFDTFHRTAENDAFGQAGERAVHFSAAVGAVLAANRERYAALEGFDGCDVDEYIGESGRADVAEQTKLYNATHLLLGIAAGRVQADPARHWRVRSGTADEHTAFTVGFNLCRAAEMAGCAADYSLIWNAGHGEVDGDGTGTFVQWVRDICK